MVKKEVEKLLKKVQKPARYTGGELNSVIKNKEAEDNEFANMVIPVYELNTDYEFNINAKTLSEVNEYVFSVVTVEDGRLGVKLVRFVKSTDTISRF